VAEIRLVRDVLDQQILDREKRKVGKVDGIVIELAEDGSARVLYIELGSIVLLRRVFAPLAGWYERLRKRFVEHPAPPFRISWKKVRHIDVALHIDIDAPESDAYHLEELLRDRFISRIPGATHGKEP
jgi:hypothetical protein